MNSIYVFFLSVITGFSGAWFISRFALSLGLIDTPNERSSHSMPTPRGGGIGILIAFLLISLYTRQEWYLWIPAAALAILSFFDDRLNLPAKLRLLLQFAAAGILLAFAELPFFSIHAIILFLIFIVGTANFYNFMDGINGIAGITGVVGFGLLAWVAQLQSADQSLFWISLSVSGACLGFLPLNIPSAKVFMGDVGSILLGFVFALLVIQLAENWVEFFAYAGLLLPFFADELITMSERIRQKKPLLEAHRQHLYQVLANEMGIQHWKVSASYGLAQLGTGVVGVALIPYGIEAVLGFQLIALFVFFIFNFQVKKQFT